MVSGNRAEAGDGTFALLQFALPFDPTAGMPDERDYTDD